MPADSRTDAELRGLRRDADLRRLGFAFLRLPGGQLAAVHARYTPPAGIRAATAEELRRRIALGLDGRAGRAPGHPFPGPAKIRAPAGQRPRPTP